MPQIEWSLDDPIDRKLKMEFGMPGVKHGPGGVEDSQRKARRKSRVRREERLMERVVERTFDWPPAEKIAVWSTDPSRGSADSLIRRWKEWR